MDRLVVKYSNTHLLNQATSARILIELGDILARQDRANIALTGGRDAADIYSLMGFSTLARTVDWSRVHLWWSDERFVGPDDPERNAEQARNAWFGHLIDEGLMPRTNVHEMPVDSRSQDEIIRADDAENESILAKAAQTYQDEIIGELGPDGHMDLAIFGVGPDGHYASLFPDQDAVLIDRNDQLVTGVNHSPKLPPMRLTLTTPFIRRTPKVWVFTSSKEKAWAVSQALKDWDNPHIPSSYARGCRETLWLLDADAAADLT